MKDASAYQDEHSNLTKKFWVGQGTLVVKGGCDFSKSVDTDIDEIDRLKKFALVRLERYYIYCIVFPHNSLFVIFLAMDST